MVGILRHTTKLETQLTAAQSKNSANEIPNSPLQTKTHIAAQIKIVSGISIINNVFAFPKDRYFRNHGHFRSL